MTYIYNDITRKLAMRAKMMFTLLTMILMGGHAVAQVTVHGDVYGGGNLATVGKEVTVNISGGTIEKDVYGGGALANTNIDAPTNEFYSVTLTEEVPAEGYYTLSGTEYVKVTTAKVGPGTYYRKIETIVNLTGGTVSQDVYGGGLGRIASGEGANAVSAVEAKVYGEVTVNVNGSIIGGSVFGCNNENGSPQGNVLVQVDQTVKRDGQAEGDFDLLAVYGGGNKAAYNPITPHVVTTSETETSWTGSKTRVIVNGCSTVSIGTVYGGGNAAPVPEANVTINGAKIIDYVYAGGHGVIGGAVANVGILDATAYAANHSNGTYGTGNATTNIYGGTINNIFAGADSNGDIIGTSKLNIEDRDANCLVNAGEVFSYGNHATMSGQSELKLGCLTNYIGALYGGAMNADIDGNIVLNINGGKYRKVFGGNKSSGNIKGYIQVNVEEKDANCPIIIDELFGCGNEAPYSVYGYETDGSCKTELGEGGTAYDAPQLNLYSFTTIGAVYGAGLGSPAIVYGDPEVNVNITKESGYTLTDIYGGGKNADVSGDTKINIGTTGAVHLPSQTGTATTEVKGAIISGDVFGGGLGSGTHVSGTATINIGERSGTAGNYTYTPHGASFSSNSNIYGGSALGAVATTQVNLYAAGTTVNNVIAANVFGGGKGQLAHAAVGTEGQEGYQPAVTAQAATVGAANVSLYNTTVTGNIYGGCNDNGIATTAVVNLIGGTVGTAPASGATSTTVNKVFGGGQGHLTTTTNATVYVGTSASVGASNIYSNVYGGSALGEVGTATVYLNKATALTGNVFGGGMGSGSDETTAATVTSSGTVWLNNVDIQTTDIYGGCNENGSAAATTVYLLDGKVHDVYGGGYGPNTYVTGNVNVYVGKSGESGDGTTVYHDVYGGSAQGHVNAEKGTSGPTTTYHDGAAIPETTPVQYEQLRYTTNVDLFKGEIKGDVYGGGLGDADHAAYVGGDVTVSVNNNNGTCKVDGGIFGCNNANGSPKGHVVVHVYQTADRTGQTTGQYDLLAVYGGGNEADYEPEDVAQSTEVVIEGCDKTSIQTVYGGGNAAAVPATDVWILGTEKIETIFGGGNGERGASYAANVGFKSDGSEYANGSGKARTKLVAGKNITTVYGGSNSNGDIRGGTWVSMPQKDEYPGYTASTSCCTTLETAHIYGGGRNAKMSSGTNIILGCQPNHWIEEIYAGSQEADVDGDVSLTITSGKFERVFGGNKFSGKLKGSITVNIEETGNCGTPIIIGELYAGGNQAHYSVYGYENDGTPMTAEELRTELTDHNPGKTAAQIEELFQAAKKNDPQLNVRAFTSIGAIYGGGYSAKMYADPTVSINVVKGSKNATVIGENESTPNTAPFHELAYPAHASGTIGTIGNVFGGGNLAEVNGSTTVNVGTESTVTFITEPKHLGTKGTSLETSGVAYIQRSDGLYEANAEGANITGNVYGGGKLANITGNTQVNICAKETGTGTDKTWTSVTPGAAGVTIGSSGVNDKDHGHVFGGGKGVANNFKCDAAMVGTEDAGMVAGYLYGNTSVTIGNGTIYGNVYGGGEVGRVEMNTTVKIGIGIGTGTPSTATSVPVIEGSVFGAGQGVDTHGYSGLARGNSRVTVEGDAWVKGSIYGGGEKASVGRYWVKGAPDATDAPENLPEGMPYALKDPNSGKCYVTIQGHAKIGPTTMTMPTFLGNVFGGCKGILPGAYSYANDANKPKRWVGTDWSYFANEAAYIQFIRTLALNNETHVTIGDANNSNINPFIKGSVYGGSENGGVMADTYVTIAGGQIGCGEGYDAPYTDWSAASLPECPHWTYGIDTNNDNKKDLFAPYDPNADESGNYVYDNTIYSVVPEAQRVTSSEGGRPASKASDGHTFYGNVFGGGSGKDPYRPGKWLMTAGGVGGNTNVTITGGHILTSVYGGNELTNVGEELVNDETKNKGKCTIRMSGGSIGVPRTLQQILDHPVTCNLFGAGKGDQRVLFNKWTNVNDVDIQITGGTIYGSVFGGGEDGHVMRDVKLEIGQASGKTTTIGTLGTSGFEGNVFGGGRGFGGDAYTAGNVAGSVDLDITGGTMLGSVYGGGRLASVGYGLYDATTNGNPTPGYGEVRDNNKNDNGDVVTYFTHGRGHIDIDISGGTIGNTSEFVYPTAAQKADDGDLRNTSYDQTSNRLLHTKGGNVFAGGMGRRTLLNGEPITADIIDWHKLGNAKSTKLTIRQASESVSTIIRGNVYGGGELGTVLGNHQLYNGTAAVTDTNGDPVVAGTEIVISGGTIGTQVAAKTGDGGGDAYYFGSVYGGGMGEIFEEGTGSSATTVLAGGNVNDSTKVSMSNGSVRGSVYGGGELGQVFGSADVAVSGGTIGVSGFGGAEYGNIYGGGKGSTEKLDAGLIKTNTWVTVSGSPQIWHNIYGGGAYGSVGTITRGNDANYIHVPGQTSVSDMPKSWATNTGRAVVRILGGTIGRNGDENGMVFGSSRGDVGAPGSIHDKLAWVYDAIVTIGDEDSGPQINGSVYGSGENGHTYHDAEVIMHSGTVGITEGEQIGTYTGAAYPYRGNVYGGGCGTDKYDSDDDGTEDSFNPLAGIVLGDASVTMDGGTVVHNIYGAGAMGSVGTMTTDTDNHLVISSGGTTTIEISGGTVGVSGTVGDGNVFGAARGDKDTDQTDVALVKTTKVTISQADGKTTNVWGNVYGGGETGDVGTYYTITEAGANKGTNAYLGGSGACVVEVTGGTVRHNVFGAGKGESSKYECKKAMVSSTDVTIDTNAKVNGNVYGGGEVGRVENNTVVKIGSGVGAETGGTSKPEIGGSVYGAGAGLETHGYSALVRGNSTVTVEGNAKVNGNVYGGGEKATVGKYWVSVVAEDPDESNRPPQGYPSGMPYATRDGGICTVNIQGYAQVGPDAGGSKDAGHVFGAGKGVEPSYSAGVSKRMKNGDVWESFNDKADYLQFLETLALASVTKVTIDGNAKVKGSVYGGSESGFVQDDAFVTIKNGEIGTTSTTGTTTTTKYGDIYGGGRGLSTFDEAGRVKGGTMIAVDGGTTKGSVYGGGEQGIVTGAVLVNINNGTIEKDVYGGGALANTNTNNWDGNTLTETYLAVAGLTVGTSSVKGYYTKSGDNYTLLTTGIAAENTTYYRKVNTTVNLLGGLIKGDAYGGALGQKNGVNGATSDIPAYVYGDVLLDLNGTTSIDDTSHKPLTTGTPTTSASGCVVGQVFGCNNVNGSPKGDVMVHVHATQNATATQIANTGEVNNAKVKGRYDVKAVYGGGNMAAYVPVSPFDGTFGSKTQVIVEGCTLTSIETVYGGGNAAAVPETNVVIKGAYEIGYLFGGGNGKDDIAPGVENPGADVGTLDHGTTTYGTGNANSRMEAGLIHEAYGGSNTKGVLKGSINLESDPKNPEDAGYCCELILEKIVGAGKYADIDGDVNMTLSCQPSSKVPLLFAGADEANVNGNITLNITNGHFGKVFGGNNLGGAIKGKITVNVEETGCQPIKIDNLYLGSNKAAYSVYGYYESNEVHEVTGKKILKPRTSEDDEHTAVENPAPDATHTFPYAQPELNIISCTYIGNVFGGGLGKEAVMYANPTVNVNMVPGQYAETAVPAMMTELGLDVTKTAPNPDKLGIIENVFGGGDAANIAGNTTVNIATVEGKSAYITGSVFGGGNAADVLGNTNVTMSGGYVFNGIFGGGYAGNVGTFTRSTDAQYTNVFGHTTHEGVCIGKPISCAEGTGKCTVLVNGGQIGPISVATEGMNRKDAQGHGDPVPQGWVWGAGQGLIEDPATHPDTHFTSYVGSTDVTIGGTALIMESIIGGGEFGRVLGNTLVKIEGGQIGVGAGMVDNDNKPIRYTDEQFIDPTTTEVTTDNALAECSHFPYGTDTDDDGKLEYLPYDPYYDKYLANNPSLATSDLGPASTANPSDGKTWIGCVFAGGSGYMPFEKDDGTGYDWCSSAGLVEGNTELIISGGHILTNVYGGNENTNVKGKCKVTMTDGTIGVPRTVEQIIAHPLTCYLFGAGKGDPRPHFNTETNVQDVEIDISGGIIYGSVFGGGEDGHVQRDVKMTIGKDDGTGPTIGTWGTSYVDGNIFGGGRGFAGDAYTAGNVAGSVKLDIKGGTMLGSIYGGGRLGSVGYGLYPPTAGDTYYGAMRPDNTGDDEDNTAISNFKRGYVEIEISGGTIGNAHEYIIPSAGNTPTGLTFADIDSWTDDNWNTWKNHNKIPLTEFDKETYRLKHTKGGNVFAGGMGRLYQLDGITPITAVDWWKVGCVKQTKLTVKGGTIKSNLYGGGELGAVKPYINGETVEGGTTEIIVQNENNTQIGTEVKDGSNVTQYTFGSVYGGGYGSTIENLNGTDNPNTENDNPKFVAGLVYGDTKIDMQGGKVLASIYGGGEVASVNGSAEVAVSGGEVGKDKVGDKLFGGPAMGNVYGGGSGHPNIVRCGRILKNTKVTISGDDTKIYHNVYGGGAYGTVGDFEYTTGTDGKVNGLTTLKTTGTGKAEIIITGGTIGIDGHENGMVFGSSRGDINKSGERDDHTAWVYDTYVTIGTQGSETGPAIKGSIYGSGENGHTFNNTDVTVHSGTVGVAADASYLYRGNVYGGGCGTDKYYSNTSLETHDGNGDTYNPLAGIVYGNTTVTIDGGQIVRNVYGAGAMGSVGKFEKNTTTNAITFASGGTTTIAISGGKIGVDGTKGDGNVFGAARGNETTKQTDVALVKTTDVTISGDATVWGNVYGGGEIGSVGTFTERADDGKYIWTSDAQNLNGLTKVSITGGETKGHVFGAGKGKAVTFKCEKAMVKKTLVSVSNGKVDKNVYGGGEIGRVEEDTEVKIGVGNGTPTILGSVYGAGAGLETHGYSALVRHNTTVTVEGGATIGQSVYGGGEIASVGRYGLDEHKMPEILLDGGYCYVTVQGSATIGSTAVQGNVFGACKGVVPHFDYTNADRSKRSRRMTVYNAEDFPDGAKIDATTGSATGKTPNGTTWEYYDESVTPKLVWEYFQEEDGYNKYLETLALATHPEVTIDGGATVNGSVYGGGEMGLTKGSVMVNILGGTITEDVYGGGALANTNTTSAVGVLDNDGIPQKESDGKYQTTTVYPKTTVNLLGGSMRDAYGGGLGQLALAAQGTEGQAGYQAAVSAIEAKVFGNVKVNLNGLQAATDINTTILNSLTTDGKLVADGSRYNVNSSVKGAVVNRVFGCNNLNGTPTKKVQVYVFGTQHENETQIANAGAVSTAKVKGRYDVQAVYGGGNLSPYKPDDALLSYTDENKSKVDAARPEVYIDGCDRTSIKQVYGGGNAAPVPATFVEIRRCYEIDEVFGGGNGFDNYSVEERGNTVWYENSGANVGYYTYATYPKGAGQGTGAQNDPYKAVEDTEYAGGADHKEARLAAKNIQYGSGIARLEVKGGTIHTSYGGSNSKGNVRAKLSSAYSAMFDDCEMQVAQSYGGGKNAYSDAETDMVADCAKGVKEMFGGAKDADMDGDINMLITNGSSLERVFGGNNTSGAVNGSITITLKEGGCEPIKIGELYAGGFLAPYSVYGYEKNEDGSYKTEPVKYLDENNVEQTKLQRIPIKSGTRLYKDPRINVISATSIGNIFGGGYQAKLVGNPHINVNMTTGFVKVTKTLKEGTTDEYIYKDVAGNTYDSEKVSEVSSDPSDPEAKSYIATTDLGTIGNIYGGGNMADIVGDTYVEIGTGTEHNDAGELVAITPARNGANITGNVFGGGKGKADSFTCEKAMVTGSNGTNVIIGNGTIGGTVYGGGEIGRVENNTVVTIGLDSETSAPVIEGNVFGAGKGVNTHGYAALVRGNTTVTVQGNAKIGKSVYGGGEIASVGKYNIADEAYHTAHPEVEVGMPYSLVADNRGICKVIVQGNAEIGPDGMKMLNTETGKPDDVGHVFGAGKGVLPYELLGTDGPKRMAPGTTESPIGVWEYYNETQYQGGGNYLDAYLRYIETLALATQTDVTISGNAFVKGSVYGGSENGHVQHDTHVTIEGDCQIGAGEGINERYTDHYGEWPTETESIETSWKECAHWEYTPDDAAPWDPYAIYESEGKYYYDAAHTQYAEGGAKVGKDGHTFYGNVFGGGSGLLPYAPGKWHRASGSVGGNTLVDITGGHILTSVYGGNEQTDVGTYEKDSKGALVVPVSGGKCTINMTGGTLGVPRTAADAKAHPVTCYLFGAGKGDQRIFFNTWTNVINTEVNISETARIYGSTFGGGEDGHVIENAETNISGTAIIGTTGTSYVDGNVFGGGRGFSGDAQTAGTVGGNVKVNISGGKMLGNIYGGGRLASVGTMFTAPDDPNYGNFVEDGTGENAKTYGHVAVNISGGIIGNTVGNAESGNVFGGSMGRLTLLDGTTINPIWPKMAQVKEAIVTISGDAVIKRNVYGGGELGTVRDNATVNINGGTVNRDVYGAGYGSKDYETKTKITVKEPDSSQPSGYKDQDYVFTPMIFAGCVGQNTYVNITGGKVRKNVYGGGEMASVGIMDCRVKKDDDATEPVYTEGSDKYVYEHFHSHLDETNGFALSWPFHFENAPGYFGATHVNITGGRIGVADGDTDINTDNGDVYGGGKGIAGEYKNYVYCANVGSAEVTIDYPAGNTATPQNYMTNADIECIAGAVYGGAENGHVMGDTKLTLKNGLIGHSMYGGGSGKGKFSTTLLKIGSTSEHYTREIYSITAGKVFGNTTVEMSGGTVVRNVYGGGNMGSVGKGNYAGGADDYSTSGYGETLTGNLWDNANDYSKAFLGSGKCTVNITGGTVGYIDESDPSNSMYPWNSTASLPYGNVFGGCRGESAPNIVETPRYLYSPEFFVGYANETAVTIGKTDGSGPTILGSVYGGGMDGHIRRDASVTILGGEIGIPFNDTNKGILGTDPNNLQWLARGNVYGSGSGIGKYKYDFDYDGKYESTVKYNNGRATVDTKEEDYSTSAGSVTRFTTVDIKGGTIHRNVYGGGSLSSIGAPKIGQSYDPYHPGDSEHSSEVGKQSLNKVTISGGQIGDADCLTSGYGGEVNGGSRGAMAFENSLANPASFANSVYTEVTISDDADVKGNVFGGGEAGIVKHDTEVKMQGGTVGNDLYGAGDMADVNGNTKVLLTGGTVTRDVFGGARGKAAEGNDPGVAANVGGDVLVDLNGGVDSTKKGAVVKGNIFGANNVNGTPNGHVLVYVHGTQNENTASINAKVDGKYDVLGVYGGGNQSDYVPTDTKQSTEVIIEGCDLTSIDEVYGGGYGAATPATSVLVKGTKIINNVYGGGYGASTDTYTNPGANVGYRSNKTLYDQGTGKAIVQLMAGTVNNVYGGSNTLGDIRGGSSVTNVANDGSAGSCDKLTVGEIYGGGKQADMYGGAEIVLGCMPNDWIGAIYAGAENADVGSDVSLTLTSGKFGRVFGGNKSGGRLNGGIEVNIEESGTCETPIIIGELYGGGNQAPYSIYGYKGLDANGKGIPRTESDYKALPDAQKEAEGILSGPNHNPVVNVKAFTSIGNIFGGGYGGTAVMIGNPIVNINEVEFDKTETGYMSNAYGGETKQIGTGDEAVEVVLYPHEDGKMGVIGNVFGGGNSAEVIGNPNVNIGTAAEVGFESLRQSDGSVPKKPVVGADIRGNVYGGGNNAAVTGDPKVVIGQRKD